MAQAIEKHNWNPSCCSFNDKSLDIVKLQAFISFMLIL